MLEDIYTILQPIKIKMNLLIGRGIFKKINNDEKIQKVQVSGVKDEVITDMERPQPYGFETYPKASDTTEAISIFPNGNRDTGFCLIIQDRELRPTDLDEGDVRIYDLNDNVIKLTADGIIIEDTNGNRITANDTGLLIEDKNGNTVTKDDNGIIIEDKNSNKIEMKSGEINITGTKVNILGATESFIKGNACQTELNKDQLLMQTLQTAISGWVPVPMDGGAALKAALAGFLALSQASYSNILSTTIKGE